MSSITIVAVPRTALHMPSPALAVLKSSVESSGHKCNTIDLNIELYNDLKDKHFSQYKTIDNYFQTDLRYLLQDSNNLDSLINKRYDLDSSSLQVYNTFLKTWAKIILDTNTDWIGISVLSVNSILPTIDLCSELKTQNPNCRIVIGGPGVSTFGIMGASNFGEFMKQNELIETYIQGEGEHSLTALLENKDYSNFDQIDKLDELPIPNYDDFSFGKYTSSNNVVAITGSRGCVRNCTFCDIKSAWKKYRYRSGANIVAEFVNHYKKYNSTEFHFTDSLVNGNLNTFREFLEGIIEEKKAGNLPANIKWSGQFICRPQHQFKEDWYSLIKQSGVKQLHIGIESGSEDVLKDMGKPLLRSDIDFMMEMLLKYEIQCDMLMIVGYPTETQKDFDDTIRMIKDYSKYSEAGVISGINLGKTMVVLPGSPIGQNLAHWDITYDEKQNWVSKKNPSLTFKERVRRRVQVQKVCEQQGYTVRWPITTLNTILAGLEKESETI